MARSERSCWRVLGFGVGCVVDIVLEGCVGWTYCRKRLAVL